MRIRSVKPDYWQHRMHKRLSVSASLLGAALLCYADDEGRFEAEAERIRGMLVPTIGLEKTVAECLVELAALDWLALYEVTLDGVEVLVGQVCAFEVHQVIQRPSRSLLPAPPAPWVRLVVIPSGKGKDGKVSPAKYKWVKNPGAGTAQGRLNEYSLMNGSTVLGTLTDDSDQRENEVIDSINDDSLGKGKERKEGNGKEGEARAPGVEEPPFRDAGGDLLDRDGGAVIPSVEEVAGFGQQCVPEAAPGEYAAAFHGHWSADHLWERNGRLRDWRHHFANWWRTDQAAWKAGEHRWQTPGDGSHGSGAKFIKKGLPAFRELQILEEEIARHPANPESIHEDKNAGPELKADLRRKRDRVKELAGVKA